MFPKKNKYNNKKTIVDGITFDSKKEAKHYSELKLMRLAGLISDIVIQPRFELLPKIKWEDKTLCKRSYVADFMYLNKTNNKTYVIDVKGFKTPMYKLKKQMFLIKYPEYIFKEV